VPSASNLVLVGGVLEGDGPVTFSRSLGPGPGAERIACRQP